MRVIVAPLLLLAAQVWAQPSFLVTHTLPPGTVIRSTALADDGGVVLGGGVDDDLNFACRLDPAGNVLWSSSMDIGWEFIGDPLIFHQPAFVRGLACLPNGNIMLVGQAGSTEWDCVTCATRHFIILDGDGEVLNDQLEYQPIRSQAWQGVLPLENGTVLLYGTHNSLSYNPGYICMYDPSSDQLFDAHLSSRQFDDFYPPDGILGMAVLTDGSYAAFGTDHIARLTNDLGSIWHLYFDANGLLDIQETSDGSLVLAWPDKLMRLTSTGELVWTKMIPEELGVVSGLESSTNGFVTVAGTTAEGVIWWGHVDLLGNIPWLEQWNETGSSFSLKGLHRHADERLSIVAQTLDAQPRVAVITTDVAGRLDACSVSGSTYELATSSIDTLLLTYNIGPSSILGSGVNSVVVLIPNYPLSTEQCGPGFLGSVSGSVYHDLNFNGNQDPEDSALAWQPVLVTPNQSYAYSTLQGYEVDYLTPGTRTLSLVHNEAIWGLSSGAGGHVVEITQEDTTITGIDFGLYALLDTAIVQCALTSAPTRCSMLIPQTINVLNQGTTAPDLVVALTMDPLITFVSSVPAPDSIAGDTIYWHIDDLPLFQQASITLQVLMPDFNSIGLELQGNVRCYQVPDGGGLIGLTENAWSSTIICSYDPNDKGVEPAGDGPAGHIPPDTDWLTYTVRFQNTGNDTAFAVVIRDQLSPLLQRGTLEVLATSHTLTQMTLTSGGLAAFHFDNILLPDSGTNEQASHGYVRFRIRPLQDLAVGSIIQNTAGIYFDLNPPVVTNTVLNTVQFCADTFALELTLVDGLFNITGNFGPWASSAWDLFYVDWYLNGEPLSVEWEGIPELPGSYTAILTRYTTGCIYETGPYVFLSTGLHEEEASEMQIAPNPFNAQLQVRYPGTHDHLELVDVNGRVVLSRSTGSASTVNVDRDGLASGIYLLRMMHGTTVLATARVVAE
ncbi:MAG: T9SS type A sorting domain-containing protein [Flavobacteriales bacterium]|nr:T9SS type A sorting domain-containing protein [Flavobacteriales bacterium]